MFNPVSVAILSKSIKSFDEALKIFFLIFDKLCDSVVEIVETFHDSLIAN